MPSAQALVRPGMGQASVRSSVARRARDAETYRLVTTRNSQAPERPHDRSFTRFRLRALLGEGASGRVHRAHDYVLGADVALKELTSLTPEALLAFKAEFRSLSDIQHPNLVRLYELFEHDGKWAFAMELVEGVDFTGWVRAGGSLDIPRLRAAVGQLTSALSALHALGLTHRDLKPANVRIDAQGRLVLLDFGLVTRAGRGARKPGAGTLEYMAPEQLREAQVGPPADFYALGVMLYEALTGELPFSGGALETLLAKEAGLPPRPSALNPQTPPELDRLCAALLEPRAHARAGAQQVLDAVLTTGETSRSIVPLQEEPFVGRYRELERARKLYERARAHGMEVLLIEGESGLGKTTLARRVAERLSSLHPGLITLASRCHAAEQVPFKLFDGIVDELAVTLATLPAATVGELVPEGAGALALMFPVLNQVEGIREQRAKLRTREIERSSAFAAFAELLAALSRRSPLMLWADDLQWSDEESLLLLEELLASGASPRAFLLITTRELASLDAKLLPLAERLVRHPRVTRLVLEPLGSDEAALLSARCLGRDVDDSRVQRIAREAKGHPLFIAELSTRAAGLEEQVPASLDDALRARFAGLDDDARGLLELLSVAFGPLPKHVLATVWGGPFDRLNRTLATLRGTRLVRLGKNGELTCYHDRIREAVLATLPHERARTLHHKLALVLQRTDADPAAVAHHFLSAGLEARALPWLEHAALKAGEQQAFERASALYQLLFSRAGAELDADATSRLSIAWSRALSAAGRSAEGAQVLLSRLDQLSPEQRTEHEGRAAKLLLCAGRHREGSAAGRRALTAVGLGWPTTQFGTLARLLWQRVALRRSGLAARAATPSTRARAQLEALWGLWQPLGWADMLRGAELGVRHLRLALEAGDPRHVGFALCAEALLTAIEDPSAPRVRELIARVDASQRELGATDLTAFYTFVQGTVSMFESNLSEAERWLTEAERRFVRDCPDDAWQLVNVRGVLLNVWFNRGQFARASRHAETWIGDARARDDRFALTTYVASGYGMLRLLMRDRPEAALAELEAVMAHWPSDQFGMQHFGMASAKHVVLSYVGGRGPYEHWRALWPVIKRSFLLRARTVRELLNAMRAEATLRAAFEAAGGERTALLRESQALLGELTACRTLLGRTCRDHLGAQLALLEGRRAEAATGFRASLEAFTRMGNMSALWCRAVLARLELPPGEAAKVHTELGRTLAQQGWVDPDRCLQTWLPAAPFA